MVLPPPAAHDESSARDAAYIEQIKLGLRLNRAGILIHVDQGRPEHLGKLVRALLPEHPDLDVFTDVRAVTRVEPGSVLVLVPKPEDADWLNLNRPIFAQRKLAVILYCDRQTTLALAERAVDFFDWVSQHHTAPDGPPDFAVQGFRKAVAANAPGIVWTGQTVEGLVRVFEKAFPGEKLRWVVPTGKEQFVAEKIRAAGNAWVACRIEFSAAHLYHFRRALVKLGKRTRAIVVNPRPEQCLGWWSVNDTCLTLEDAQSIFCRIGCSSPGRLAALTGLEKDSIDLASDLRRGGVKESDLLNLLTSDADPGVALAKCAHAMESIDMSSVAYRMAPAPVLRALDSLPEVLDWREALIKKVESARMREKKGEIGFWVAVAQLAPPLDSYLRMTDADWQLLHLETKSTKLRDDRLQSSRGGSLTTFFIDTPTTILELPTKTISRLVKGEYIQALKSLVRQKRHKPRTHPHVRLIDQIRARIYLDLVKYGDAATTLYSVIEREGEVNGPSTPLFAELMVDLALLLHRKGDTPTSFALLRKLLAAEMASLHVDGSEVGEAMGKATRSASVNDFIHLFLAQSNTPPPLPPESRARALRILAEVLLAQGRYEETEDVAQKAHETALNASEIARPEIWRALALLGRARALQGRSVEGQKDLERAIKLATDAFGKTHAEVARLWLDLARILGRIQDNDTTDTIRKAIDTWKHAECDVKERDDALEELQRLLQ